MNALCNLSRKKLREVAASLLGRFLSRCCFTLCITMEAEPRIAKQYKCHHCCSCKNYRGKGMEGGKNNGVIFWLTRRSRVRGKNVLGHPIAGATSYCLLPDTFYNGSPKMPLKLAVKNSQIYYHRLPLRRKYAPEVKAAKGLKRCRAKVKGVNNHA